MRKLWLPAFSAAWLVAGCEPTPRAEAPAGPEPSPTPLHGTSVVPIPEEFQSPPEAPSATPAPAATVTPRILFAVTDIQVTTKSGIQGIMAGETVNLIREVGDELIVQYGDMEFIKPKSFFSATFVNRKPAVSEPAPAAQESAGPEEPAATPSQPAESLAQASPAAEGPVETIGLTAPVPAAPVESVEDPLPGEPARPRQPVQLSPEEKKMAQVTDSIRTLNDRIREAQGKIEASGKKPTRAQRAELQSLKDERDELSRQLTKLGKP